MGRGREGGREGAERRGEDVSQPLVCYCNKLGRKAASEDLGRSTETSSFNPNPRYLAQFNNLL